MGKGGGGGSTPRLVDDNLKNKQFLNVIDLVSEGPIEGPVGGMQGFLLNGTPVVDKHNNPNISGVEVQWRAGTQSQSPLENFPFVEKEIPVNVELKKETAILRTVSDQETDRVRFTLGTTALVQQDSQGNQDNASVQMSIEFNDGSGWQLAKMITIGPGKISGQYLESHIIDAPKNKPFQIRVSRLTEDSKSDLLKNGTLWASYTEITDAKFSYPNSAVVGMRIDKSQYGDVPTRTYHIKGMIIQVPDNYDPETRTYNGIWTGKLKPAYSNNPAWVFYDLATHPRYSIGDLLGNFGCDKFALYAIGRYCDERVPDGFGGSEPRFTFNAYLTTQRKAKEVLDDLTSVFRGMPLWDGLQLTCFQDRPSDPVWTFTNSNVIDGKFNYPSAAKSARHNAIEVSWINPDNGWQEEREFIQDDRLIERFGALNVKKVTAFGCTSRGQAHRVGKWILETEKLETDSVIFTTGREGINCIPGDIVEVADEYFAAAKVGGRVLNVNGTTVQIDSPIEWKPSDKGTFSYLGHEGKFAKVEISSVNNDLITLKQKPNGLKRWGIFSVSKNTLVTRLFRVITITENKDGNYQFNCVQHEPQKERIVDDGVDFSGNPPTQNVIRIPNIERLSIAYVEDSTQIQARAMWATTTINRNITFDVLLYRNNKVVTKGNTADLEYYFNGLDAGEYLVGVRGKDTNGMLGEESKVQLVIGAPAAPSFIRTESGFFEIKVIPHISAPHTINTEFEFWFSGEARITNINEIESKAEFLGRAKYWTKGQLRAGHDYWFYVRSVNEYGKSYFVEASGQPDNHAKEILDEVDKGLKETETIKQLNNEINYLNEAVLIAGTANLELSRDLLVRDGENKAGIKELWRVRATDNEAWAQSITEIYAQVGENKSGIIENKQSIVTLDKSFSQSEQRVQAQFKEQQAIIDTKATTMFEQNGNGYATHSINVGVKVDGVEHRAGMVIGAEVKNGAVSTLIGFSAQQFAFYNPANGKMNLFLYMKDDQVFMNEAFINQAWLNKVVVTDKMVSDNFVSGKSGFSIDAKTGNAEFNNAIVRGTIDGADGRFTGTVYAERLIGDIATAGTYPEVSAYYVHGGAGGWQRIKSSIIYAGGMPYEIDLVFPVIETSYSGSSSSLQERDLYLVVDGISRPVHTQTAIVTIPAGKKNVLIELQFNVRHKSGATIKIFEGAILACKHSSSSFKKVN